MSDTPIHDALLINWNHVRDLGESRGRLLERREILKQLAEIQHPSPDLLNLIEHLTNSMPKQKRSRK